MQGEGVDDQRARRHQDGSAPVVEGGEGNQDRPRRDDRG